MTDDIDHITITGGKINSIKTTILPAYSYILTSDCNNYVPLKGFIIILSEAEMAILFTSPMSHFESSSPTEIMKKKFNLKLKYFRIGLQVEYSFDVPNK